MHSHNLRPHNSVQPLRSHNLTPQDMKPHSLARSLRSHNPKLSNLVQPLRSHNL